MFCGKCGGMIEDGSRFCEYCGAPQIVPGAQANRQAAQPVNPVYTNNVNTANIPNNPNVNAKNNNGSKSSLIIIICLVVALIIAIGVLIAMFFITKNKDDADTSVSTTEVSESEIEEKESEAKKEAESKEAAKSSTSKSSKKETASKASSSAEKATEGAAGKTDYIIADSANKTLTDADLAGLGAKELSIARNEIYARHGRSFKTKALQDYFDEKSWYSKNDGYTDDMLSTIEKTNAEFISQYEDSHGGKYQW